MKDEKKRIDLRRYRVPVCIGLLLPVLGLFALPNARAQETVGNPLDILVIVNRNCPVTSTTKEEVKNIFLGKRQRWKNDDKVLPVQASKQSELRKAFVENVLSMTVSSETVYWQKRKIRYGGTVPPEFGNTLKAVFKIKNSISYVYRKDFKERVAKVVLIIPAR